MLKRPENNNPTSPASRFRRRRFQIIEALLKSIIEKQQHASILDVGGKREYWNLLSPSLTPNVSILLLNVDAEIDFGPKAGGDDGLKVEYRHGDGCNMSEFGDRSFDLAHSNSVIEHVGSLQNMVRFAREMRRVGNAYYVQTPYLWFPIDPHYGVPFVHWLPGPARAALLRRFNLGYATRQPDYLTALEVADHTQIVDKTLMRNLFPDGKMVCERFALMTKSLMMVREPVL